MQTAEQNRLGKQKHREKKRVVKVRHVAKSGRREELEAKPMEWLMFYLGESFPYPWGDVHYEIQRATYRAVETGESAIIVAPRGSGKSTELAGLALLLLLSGRIDFIAYLPWNASAVKRALKFWKNALCFNQQLAADYPEICDPFVASRGVPQKLNAAKWPDGRLTGAELRLTEGMIVLPDGLGVIGSATVNGNPRGLNHTTNDGEVLRPKFALVDDPQDKDTAKSAAQVNSICEMIDSDIAGMAGPQERMPIVMAATIIKRADVPSRYVERKDWHVVRVAQITAWPTDIKAWGPIREALQDKREPEALAHYAAHRDALTAGMAVSWNERYDRGRGEPDALYSAMRDFYMMGEAAFMAERQNEPLEQINSQYEITVPMVCAHVMPFARLHLPEFAQVFVGHIDINRSGLHYCLAGYDQNMTAHCPAWGKWPEGGADLWEKNAPELVRKQAIFKGLKELCGRIATTQFMRGGVSVKPSMILIDRGYEPDVVHKFCAASSYPFRVMPSRGYAAQKYWPRPAFTVGRPMEGCHVTRDTERGQYVSFNACLWRETSQRAFLAEVGSPGGFTLWTPDNSRGHVAFAEQVVAEKLANKYTTDGGMRWEWSKAIGAVNDYGDALTGAYVAAAMAGLSPSGQSVTAKAKPRRARGISVVQM